MLKIQALDPLFFRDGKPFTMGEDAGAESMFPPVPSVFYGALRTLYFSEHPELFMYIKENKLFNTDADSTKYFHLRGAFLEEFGEPLFPLPYDCVNPDGEEGTAYLLQLEPNELISSRTLPMVLRSPIEGQVENMDGAVMTLGTFLEYLHGQSTMFGYKEVADSIVKESKTGIGLNQDRRSTEDGKLYRLSMVRMEPKHEYQKQSSPLSFVLDYDRLTLPAQGVMRLGGEGRLASFEQVEPFVIPAPALSGNRFKLYFATPSFFRRGWLPKWIDPHTLTGEYKGIGLKLLSVAAGKYVPIGGFDMNKNRPKTMRRAG
ncbi:type III-B CRISPR module-associated protein Cmr3, partial [Aneurinibacillus sp. UBA3580]|uniref:type III-B CRISPR module-associated protein Cmr3 n=1 Tax=Aneurinibacillus sp. UBA3580 TaxID=1946041 RepID=UPI00258058A7